MVAAAEGGVSDARYLVGGCGTPPSIMSSASGEFGKVFAFDMVPAPKAAYRDVQVHLRHRERHEAARKAWDAFSVELSALDAIKMLAHVLDMPPGCLAAVDEFLARACTWRYSPLSVGL